MSSRAKGFAAVVMLCLFVSIAYGWRSIARSRAMIANETLPAVDLARFAPGHDERREVPTAAAPVAAVDDSPHMDEPHAGPAEAVAHAMDEGDARRDEALPAAPSVVPAMLVRHTGLDRSYGVMAVDAANGRTGVREATTLRCDRVYFALDRGVCLTTDRLYATQSLIVFDAAFEEQFRLPLSGLPSRARVSADGRRAATTVFVTGHSYSAGAFSTETSVIDTHSGQVVIDNLQNLPTYLDGRRIDAIDVNYWGVTFMPDGDGFYATLGTGDHVYLVRGSIAQREMRVVRDGVECPSISPDGTRIAFKKRTGRVGVWRIHVLDVASLQDRPVAEARSVDDQVEWLDAGTLVYALPRDGGPVAVTDLWATRADGTGEPWLLARDASSPSVVRAGRWATIAVR